MTRDAEWRKRVRLKRMGMNHTRELKEFIGRYEFYPALAAMEMRAAFERESG